MYDKNSDLNLFTLSGRMISRTDRKDKKSMITMFVLRDGREDFIKVTCDTDMLPASDKLRVRLDITGHSVFTVISNGKGKKKVPSQYLIADSITESKTLTDDAFGVTGKFVTSYKNNFLLNGIVKNVSKKNGWTRYTVIAPTQENDDNILYLGQKDLDRPIEVNAGDRICVVGHISSTKKKTEGKDVYYEDLIVEDLAVVK